MKKSYRPYFDCIFIQSKSCSVDRGAWQAMVHGVADCRKWLSAQHTEHRIQKQTQAYIVNDLSQRRWGPTVRNRPFLQMMLKKPGLLHAKERKWTLFCNIHKNQLQMDERLKCKILNYKTPRRKHRGNCMRLVLATISWLMHQKWLQHKQEWTNETTSNSKASAECMKQSTAWKGNLHNGRTYLKAIYMIKG